MRYLIVVLGIGCGGGASNPQPGNDLGMAPGSDGGAADLSTSGSDLAPRGDLAFVLDHPDVGPPPSMDPVEAIPGLLMTRVKSPGQRMHFTAGLPFRMLADATDPNSYLCPPGHPPYNCPGTYVSFFIDGQLAGMLPPDADNQNLWDLRLPSGLPAGDHVLTVQYQPYMAATIDGLVPVYITVDPVPQNTHQVSLSADLLLSGNTDLDWSDAYVQGNGHKVTAAPGYSGKVHIDNSLVTGLGAYSDLGISVTTSGEVAITNSIFEATAPLQLQVNGSGAVTFTGNEFRSTNWVTFVASDPTKSPILDLSGNSTGTKLFQGNRVGSGIVLITNMSGWQIGGLHDPESNIFIGPRCVLDLVQSPKAVIQGNYLHHDYYGGFSQGYNLDMDGVTDALSEHNVIRDSSWPVQSVGGELRYNLLVDSGHDFIRSAAPGAKIHHNLFVHTQGPEDYGGAVYFYSGETNVSFDNNTVDVGGMTGRFDSPFLVFADPSVLVASVRNNVFTQAVGPNGIWQSPTFVAGGASEATVAAPRVTTADYNLWYNPLASSVAHYQPGIVASSPGAHDVDADPRFAGSVPQAPYQIDEGMVWLRQYGVSQVLGYYRQLYTPRSGSPLIDSGDPAGGAGNDIGAIGAGTANPADQFGLVMQAN
jgi:hypothetical protein